MGIEGPWYIQLGVLLGLLISLSTVLRLIVWPGLKKIWQAIIAAPKIADGVGKLIELLEIDIQTKIVSLEKLTAFQEERIKNLEAIVSQMEVRLTAHDKRADANEIRIKLLEENRN